VVLFVVLVLAVPQQLALLRLVLSWWFYSIDVLLARVVGSVFNPWFLARGSRSYQLLL
jgi:hypothetical protein